MPNKHNNLKTALDDIVEDLQRKMNDLLPEAGKCGEQKLLEAMRYSALSPSKKLRPFLVCASAGLFGVGREVALQTAAALEFIHVYSLIHDDLPAMDNDEHLTKSDIDYDAYLANDRTLDDPEIVQTTVGERVRLRIINGATSTNFVISLGALKGQVVAIDGINIVAQTGSAFPISIAQRLDIILQIPANGAYPILALREGAYEQTGIILATTAAEVKKISPFANSPCPALNLEFEKTLVSAEPLPTREPTLNARYNLEGTMSPYSWNFVRLDTSDTNELVVHKGDRVKVSIRNASMMAHPVHMHGHHFQVVAINDEQINGAVRDTILLPPHAIVDIVFDANNPGKWPLHCHHLYHMVSGMMTFVRYEGF
mgnify:CR=1 FL=1